MKLKSKITNRAVIAGQSVKKMFGEHF